MTHDYTRIMEYPQTVIYRGRTYRRWPDSPRRHLRVYYQTRRKVAPTYLHRDVYEHEVGPIPDGFVVHHVDGNPLNNDPVNLQALAPGDHRRIHPGDRDLEAQREHLEAIRPLAAAWHRSPEGRSWHKQHGRRVWETMPYESYECRECGDSFESRNAGGARYCSHACGERARRRQTKVVDGECAVCTAPVRQDSKGVPRTCSASCRATLMWAERS